MKALYELQQIVNDQTTVRTSKLQPLLQQLSEEILASQETAATTLDLQAEVNRKEAVIVRLQGEIQQHTLVRERHKVAMQDYENLKRNMKRLKDEHNLLIASKTRDKDKFKTLQRELTDCQVKLVRYEKKLRKAGLL